MLFPFSAHSNVKYCFIKTFYISSFPHCKFSFTPIPGQDDMGNMFSRKRTTLTKHYTSILLII